MVILGHKQVHALKMRRNYLLIMKFKMMIYYGVLKYLFEQPKLNENKTRWLTLINEFNFKIKYIKGKENKVVDGLSMRLQLTHVASVSSCELTIQENIKEA